MHENIRIVKDNLSSFWTTCFSTNPNFEVINKNDIFYTVSDINDPLMNAVLSSNLPMNEIAHRVNDIQSYYKRKNLSFCWWVDSSFDSPELSKQLEKNQFTLFGDVSGMVANIETAKTTLPSSSEIEIIEVTNESDLEGWITPIQIAFGMSQATKEQYLAIFKKLTNSNNPPIHFVAKFQDKIVGSSTLFPDKVAGIYNCATLPEYRGKGILSLLTVAMLSKAKEMGYKQVTLQASPMSVNIFRKHGFQDIVPYKVYLMGTE